nr:hypothetical protein [Mammaliicoccus sp. Marseille-Q6498]
MEFATAIKKGLKDNKKVYIMTVDNNFLEVEELLKDGFDHLLVETPNHIINVAKNKIIYTQIDK